MNNKKTHRARWSVELDKVLRTPGGGPSPWEGIIVVKHGWLPSGRTLSLLFWVSLFAGGVAYGTVSAWTKPDLAGMKGLSVVAGLGVVFMYWAVFRKYEGHIVKLWAVPREWENEPREVLIDVAEEGIRVGEVKVQYDVQILVDGGFGGTAAQQSIADQLDRAEEDFSVALGKARLEYELARGQQPDE